MSRMDLPASLNSKVLGVRMKSVLAKISQEHLLRLARAALYVHYHTGFHGSQQPDEVGSILVLKVT